MYDVSRRDMEGLVRGGAKASREPVARPRVAFVQLYGRRGMRKYAGLHVASGNIGRPELIVCEGAIRGSGGEGNIPIFQGIVNPVTDPVPTFKRVFKRRERRVTRLTAHR